MNITLHWQHLILLSILPLWLWFFWDYRKNPDAYGIGALVRLFFFTTGTLFILCIYYALGYYGAF